MSIKEDMLEAKSLIQQKRYNEARSILEDISHPTAKQWIAKIDEISMDFGDPFGESSRVKSISRENASNLPSGVSRSERDAARMKSYTTQLVVVIILYWFFFVPGLIANIIWHEEGKRMEAIAGRELPGVGGLGFLRRWIFIILLLVVGFVFLTVMLSTASLLT